MLRSAHELENYAIRATDGDVGHVKDLYFDDEAWVVRYFVVDTGRWLSSKRVLISPISVDRPNWIDRVIPVAITKDQVKHSPDIDTDKPVSRQYEIGYLRYYGYPHYWEGVGYWGDGFAPTMGLSAYGGLVPDSGVTPATYDRPDEDGEDPWREPGDPHLRSSNAVTSYRIQATDGDIGHVQDLIVDEDTWAIRYIVVNTSNWWLDNLVVIAPEWIDDVSWSGATISVDLTRQQVQDAPPYDPLAELDRTRESEIYGYYGRTGYWDHETHGDGIKRSDYDQF